MCVKFFEGQNFNTTVQVLLNILLNGEFKAESLYAGTILLDFCTNPSSFELIKTYDLCFFSNFSIATLTCDRLLVK